MTPGTTCVAGATGYLSRRVVAELRARARPVVAVLKDRSCPAEQTALVSQGAALAFVDAARLEPYAAALSGALVAISCMASADIHVDATDDFWAIDRDANIRFGLEAVRAGVRHVVLVATFEGRASRHLSAFSEAKECAVDAIGVACRQAGVAFTVIRPKAYFSDLTDRAFDSVLKKDRHTVIGDGSHRINPVAGNDVATFLVDCNDDPARAGREHPVGGPDIFSFREIGLLAAQVLGKAKSPKINSISVWGLQLVAALAAVAGVASRGSRRSAAMLRWMIYSGTHDAIAPACGALRLRDEFCAKRDALPDRGVSA
jgi:uncharacterized protein YbjT (DUF2867 family)